MLKVADFFVKAEHRNLITIQQTIKCNHAFIITRKINAHVLMRARPGLTLSTDIIVGFPGETEADFEDTLDLVRRVTYAQAYSFKYSPPPRPTASTSISRMSAARCSRQYCR